MIFQPFQLKQFYDSIIMSFDPSHRNPSILLCEMRWKNGHKNFISHPVPPLPFEIETLEVSDCLKPPQMGCFPEHDTATCSISGTVSNCPRV